MGYDTSDFICCEVCNEKAVDIHHINARGMGGSKEADKIENLQALCRSCHEIYGDKKIYKDMLQTMHRKRMAERMRKRDV
jgi:uncharacterized protein with PIN domain